MDDARDVLDPLVVQAMRKAAIVWLGGLPGLAADRAILAWCAWADTALYVLSGTGEQRVPGLAEATRCTVTGRGDNGARIVTWPATVHRVPPEGPEWHDAVPRLRARRLNLPADDDTTSRWARDCLLSRLTPAGAAAPLPSDALAATPPGRASR